MLRPPLSFAEADSFAQIRKLRSLQTPHSDRPRLLAVATLTAAMFDDFFVAHADKFRT